MVQKCMTSESQTRYSYFKYAHAFRSQIVLMRQTIWSWKRKSWDNYLFCSLKSLQNNLVAYISSSYVIHTITFAGCYPFTDKDPFYVETCPHVYFVGNQDKFETRLIKGMLLNFWIVILENVCDHYYCV